MSTGPEDKDELSLSPSGDTVLRSSVPAVENSDTELTDTESRLTVSWR